jgi:hypothetical protein
VRRDLHVICAWIAVTSKVGLVAAWVGALSRSVASAPVLGADMVAGHMHTSVIVEQTYDMNLTLMLGCVVFWWARGSLIVGREWSHILSARCFILPADGQEYSKQQTAHVTLH